MINAPGVNGKQQNNKQDGHSFFEMAKSCRVLRPEEEPYTKRQHSVDERMHPKCRLKMTGQQKQHGAAHSTARTGNAGCEADRAADACERKKSDVKAEQQAEEKEIAAAFLKKRKIRAAAAGIMFHGVW